MGAKPVMTIEDFFDGVPETARLMGAVMALLDSIGPFSLRVSKSQIAICRKKPFAWVWIPGRYLHGMTAPLVLSIAFSTRHPSPRWKEVAPVSKKRLMHHLELHTRNDLDDEVAGWLRSAWESAQA